MTYTLYCILNSLNKNNTNFSALCECPSFSVNLTEVVIVVVVANA